MNLGGKVETAWDYTKLAEYYVKRPPYSDRAVDRVCSLAGLKRGVSDVCDIGAGTGALTKMLLERGFRVTAVEPNDAMRPIGRRITEMFGSVIWHEGVAEKTGMPNERFDLVTFGSSFNTTDRQNALAETARILKRGGWFACMWNHRDLDDPVQKGVEDCIRSYIPEYAYGTRREDQTKLIRASGLFNDPISIEESHIVSILRNDYIDAWRSHATLYRQAVGKFNEVIEAISQLINGYEVLQVPYTTRGWTAPKLNFSR
jgi:SAM-dependent methyltransferase